MEIRSYLNKCIEKNALSHAYIFYGPNKALRVNTGIWFANQILKNEPEKFHPDLFIIQAEMITEETAISLVRQIKSFLVLKPYSSRYKVVIVESAEKLHSAAQNALLKIFEEAPQYAVIVLGANTLSAIPDTIASRAIKVPFWRLQPEIFSPDKTFNGIVANIFTENSTNKYKDMEKLNSYNPLTFFKYWLNFLRIELKNNPNEKLRILLSKSQNIYFKLIETNSNPKFAYDELLLLL